MFGYMRRQGVGTDIVDSGLSNCYCYIVDQVLDLMPEGPTVVGIVSRGIHM